MPAIDFSVCNLDGIRPEAHSFLARYGSDRFHHAEYGLRHPAAAYAISVERVWPAFLGSLDLAEQVAASRSFGDPTNNLWHGPLLEAHERLLYSLFEHLEDCESILQCCLPKATHFGRNPSARTYRQAISTYRARIGRIVNTIKHRQGRLRPVVFFGPKYASLGYFVEGVLPNGAIGPDPRVHASTSQAFSFALDLRLHYFMIFLASRALNVAVEEICGAPSPTPAIPNSSDLRVWQIAGRLSRFTTIIFPDESPRLFSAVEVRGGPHGLELHLSCPSDSVRNDPLPPASRITVAFGGDGFSRSFVLPYKPAG